MHAAMKKSRRDLPCSKNLKQSKKNFAQLHKHTAASANRQIYIYIHIYIYRYMYVLQGALNIYEYLCA